MARHLYIIAKLEAGWPLSVSDRDIILETVRKEWMTTKEYSAWRRQRELHQIEAVEKIAEQPNVRIDADEVLQHVTGRSLKGAKQFAKRERKKREFFTDRSPKRKRKKRR